MSEAWHRRIALQLASLLPAESADARLVLEALAELAEWSADKPEAAAVVPITRVK